MYAGIFRKPARRFRRVVCEKTPYRQSYFRIFRAKPNFTQRIYAFLLHPTVEYGIIAIPVCFGEIFFQCTRGF